MIKILDLFAGTQSVRKALDDMGMEYDYIGIDIYSPEEENLIFDLTQDNVVEKLVEKLPKGWVPDFIWASPVCNKFSTACAYTGGNLFFEIQEGETIKIRENWNDENNRAYPKDKCAINKPRYQEEAAFALLLHTNTKKIIDYFNVPFIIENPRRAMSKYLYKDYIANPTSYCMYGYEYEKPTAIYSNRKLDLKVCNHKPKREYHTIMLSGSAKDYTNGRKNMSNYAKRSSVPPKLIQDIITQILGDK